MSDFTENPQGTGVAIIGMAGRFPGARDLEAFWRNLRDGVESITVFDDAQLKARGVPASLLEDPAYVKARGVLDDVDLFAAGFFGYSPRDATIMDPQQRSFLECAWEALESAAYDPKSYQGLIGVYGGTTASSYLPLIYADSRLLAQTDPMSIAVANELPFVTTRVSYKLDLKGPSCPIQTACSTALVAVHLACQGLLNAECDLALAGAASIRVPQENGYFYQQDGILSPDGHCRPFDSKAQGTLFSNGIGVILLKRLDDAIADGDHIHAVIKGSAINNDGARKASFTAPAVGGQYEVIVNALINAEVEPEAISYIETHGTATALGDSIEMQALTKAFAADGARRQYCALGSVKSNFGHLDAAAGIAGLIKTVLALQHEQLPPSLHYQQSNPDIDFTNSPFYVNARLSQWRSGGASPRRAGVSAFGFGGTNAHVILEEAPATEPSGPSRRWQLLTLSGQSESTLENVTSNFANHLRSQARLNLADAAYTLAVGRRAFRHRRIAVSRGVEEAASVLETRDPRFVFSGVEDGVNRPVVFLFPGQGSQHVNMGRELYENELVFREVVDQCTDQLKPHLDLDLRCVLYPAETETETASALLRRTRLAQPALFVVEYALARLWQQWGIEPDAYIGHSIGEYVAACLSGVLKLDDALRLVALRGKLMEQMPPGVMVAVPLPEERVQRLLVPGLWLSVVNSPSTCVVSGRDADIQEFETRLGADGVSCQRLHTSHAFHSGLMDDAVSKFVEAVKQTELGRPGTPYISNVTGTWIEEAQTSDPKYWGRQLRETVRFSSGVAELLKQENRVFLEVGPGQTLGTLVRQQAMGKSAQIVLSSLRHAQQQGSDVASLLTALGRLWLSGVQVDWSNFYRRERRQRVALPTYPFERQRYWVGQDRPDRRREIAQRVRPAGKSPNVGEWFYTPTWARAALPVRIGEADATWSETTWLVFKDGQGIGDRVVERLDDAGSRTVVVDTGARFAKVGNRRYTIDPKSATDYKTLIRQLSESGLAPHVVVHLWGVGLPGCAASPEPFSEQDHERGFGSLLLLAKALAEANLSSPVRIGVVTSGAHEVTGDERLVPGKATVLGLSRVVPQEYPEISCRIIDLGGAGPDRWTGGRHSVIDQLLQDVVSASADAVVAYRGGHRWVLGYRPVQLAESDAMPRRLRSRGVYLITGGLGDIGLNFAEYLAQECTPDWC